MAYYDGDFSSPVRMGPARPQAPFPSNEFCVVEEDFRQTYIDWLAGTGAHALGDAHPTLTGYYLVKVGDPRREGPTVVYTLTWAKIPTSFNTYDSISYQFIGFYGVWGVNVTTVTGRDRFVRTVQARYLHQFFLCISGQTYETPGDIPVIAAQKYIYGASTNDVDFLADSPPFAEATTPSRATYEGWMTAESEIVPKDSVTRQWLGPMHERVTPYIVAL